MGLYDLLDKEVGTENLYSIIHYQSKQLEFFLDPCNRFVW